MKFRVMFTLTINYFAVASVSGPSETFAEGLLFTFHLRCVTLIIRTTRLKSVAIIAVIYYELSRVVRIVFY